MNHELFQKLNEVTIAISKLEDEKRVLRELVVKEMQKHNEKNVEYPFAVYMITERKVWAYTHAVADKENEIKNLKRKEQTDGLAICKVVPTLVERLLKKKFEE